MCKGKERDLLQAELTDHNMNRMFLVLSKQYLYLLKNSQERISQSRANLISRFIFDVPNLTESFLADMCWSKKLDNFSENCTYLLDYFYFMQQTPSWEANQFSASQEIPRISLLHAQVPATCPYPEPAQSSPYTLHPTSWRSILMSSSHLCLGLPSGLFPSDLPTKTLYTPLLSPNTCYMPHNLTLLDFITQTMLGEEYRSFSSSLYSFSTPLLPRPS